MTNRREILKGGGGNLEGGEESTGVSIISSCSDQIGRIEFEETKKEKEED